MIRTVRPLRLGSAALSLAVAISACSESTAPDPCRTATPAAVADVTFAAALGIDLAEFTVNDAGVYVRDNSLGSGTQAEAGDIIRVTYVGRLADGTEFDSGTIRFQLGVGQVIIGWDRGFEGMLEGGTRTLIIPPALAYGTCAVGRIPDNSVLVFDMELLQVE